MIEKELLEKNGADGSKATAPAGACEAVKERFMDELAKDIERAIRAADPARPQYEETAKDGIVRHICDLTGRKPKDVRIEKNENGDGYYISFVEDEIIEMVVKLSD